MLCDAKGCPSDGMASVQVEHKGQKFKFTLCREHLQHYLNEATTMLSLEIVQQVLARMGVTYENPPQQKNV